MEKLFLCCSKTNAAVCNPNCWTWPCGRTLRPWQLRFSKMTRSELPFECAPRVLSILEPMSVSKDPTASSSQNNAATSRPSIVELVHLPITPFALAEKFIVTTAVLVLAGLVLLIPAPSVERLCVVEENVPCIGVKSAGALPTFVVIANDASMSNHIAANVHTRITVMAPIMDPVMEAIIQTTRTELAASPQNGGICRRLRFTRCPRVCS